MKLLVLMTVVAVAGAQDQREPACSYRSGPELNSIIETGVRNETLFNIALQVDCADACCTNVQCNWFVHQAANQTCQLWQSAEQRGQMPGFVSAEKGEPLPTQPLATRPDNDAAMEGPMVVTFVLSLAVSLLLYANDVLM